MIHYTCDLCGDAIVKPQTSLEVTSGRLEVRILRALDGAWSGGQVCSLCLLRAAIEALGGER